jgi:hypothetical protein
MLRWSDNAFWNATPRKFHACCISFAELNKKPEAPAQDVLTGSDAIKDMIGTVGKIKV